MGFTGHVWWNCCFSNLQNGGCQICQAYHSVSWSSCWFNSFVPSDCQGNVIPYSLSVAFAGNAIPLSLVTMINVFSNIPAFQSIIFQMLVGPFNFQQIISDITSYFWNIWKKAREKILLGSIALAIPDPFSKARCSSSTCKEKGLVSSLLLKKALKLPK